MNYANLKLLPQDHVLRNTPLADINAELRDNASAKSPWKRVEKHWGIAGNCYNDLGNAWRAYADWRAPTE